MMDVQATSTWTLAEAIEAIQHEETVEELKKTPISPAIAGHLSTAQNLILCAEVMTTILYADEFAKNDDGSYIGLSDYQRGALLSGMSTMLMSAHSSIHNFATSAAKRLGAG